MTDTVFTKFYSDIHVDKSEILRYMGCREADETTLSLVEECHDRWMENARNRKTKEGKR